MSAQETDPAVEQIPAEQLAAAVASATDEQLAEGMASESRELIVGEIFRRMAEHLNADSARDVSAVIHWKILDRPGGGYDHYEVVIENGSCTVSDEPARDPRVTLSVQPVPFLKLVSGHVSGPELFITGKLKIKGDLLFAARVAGLFRIPRPAA
jgi:putative sterol carrier protein